MNPNSTLTHFSVVTHQLKTTDPIFFIGKFRCVGICLLLFVYLASYDCGSL